MLAPALDRPLAEEVGQYCDLLERFSILLVELESSGNDSCLQCAASIESASPVGQARRGGLYQECLKNTPGEGSNR